jgi:ADP-heptose:LPS heptosyltransferase
MKQDKIPNNLENILIISLGTIGDVVLSLAAIEAIRNYHSNAHIVLITEAYCARLFEKAPFVDEIVTNFRANGFKEELHLGSQLQKAKFDVVYDLSCNEQTELLFKKFWPRKPLWSGNALGCSHPHIDRNRDKLHILDRQAEQLWLCGIGPIEGYPLGTAPLPNLGYLFGDFAPNDVSRFGIVGDYAILIPEAPMGDNKSAWPTFRYVALAEHLQNRKIRPIIVGTNEAIAIGNEIRAGAPNALDLVGRLDLTAFAALVKNANLVVGSNSDMAIIAAAVGAPLLALINPLSNNLRQAAPRGNNCVTLVSKDFAQIDPTQIIQAARAVMN